MRDSFNKESNWALLDAGPYGSAHQHVDSLHLDISLDGRDFLVDQGRYNYRPGKWRQFFAGIEGHNTIEFQGLRPRPRPHYRRSPIDPVLLDSENVTIAWGGQWHDSMTRHEVPSWQHRRFLVHLKNDGFIVVDHLLGFGPATGITRWHFDSSLDRSEIENQYRLLYPKSNDTKADWHRGSLEPIAGWSSQEYDQKMPAWQADFTTVINGPQVMIWSFGLSSPPAINIHGTELHFSSQNYAFVIDLKKSAARLAQ
jgi:hypothetical protein